MVKPKRALILHLILCHFVFNELSISISRKDREKCLAPTLLHQKPDSSMGFWAPAFVMMAHDVVMLFN